MPRFTLENHHVGCFVAWHRLATILDTLFNLSHYPLRWSNNHNLRDLSTYALYFHLYLRRRSVPRCKIRASLGKRMTTPRIFSVRQHHGCNPETRYLLHFLEVLKTLRILREVFQVTGKIVHHLRQFVKEG